jgi:molybdopterin synthase sulfur carrier subunit
MVIRVLYFARLRERLELASEELEGDFPQLDTVVTLLKARGGVWEEEFSGDQVLMAVSQEMADIETVLRDGDEVAFFPPVSGG